MDPYVNFAVRDSSTFPVLLYDPKFIYERDSYVPIFNVSTEMNQNVYVAPELLTMMEEEKSSFFIPDRETIVLERANPFIKIPKFVKNAEMKAFDMLFHFKGTKITINPIRRHLQRVLEDGILVAEPFDNILAELPMAVNELWMHFVYLMTKFYKRVTLLQLAMSNVRYLIAMDYTGIPSGWRDELETLVSSEDSRELTTIFRSIPSCFSTWFTFMNNVHIAKVVETLLFMRGQKDAFDGKAIFTSMPSYDLKRVVNLLTGQPIIQQGVKSKSFRFLKEIDEEFVRGLHLYGEPANFSDIPIHKTIDMEHDVTMEYSRGHRLAQGGVHWGQRKLLDGEIAFFTHFLEPNDTAVAYYIGAAPFIHGSVLLEMFPNLTFILCDPRNAWDEKIRTAASKPNPRVFIQCVKIDAQYISDLQEQLSSKEASIDPTIRVIKNAKKFFFLSDIRSTSVGEVGAVQNDINVHADMTLQADIIYGLSMVFKDRPFAASLKFRLPFYDEIGGTDYEYAGGILNTQPWSGLKSAELRLWWTPTDGRTLYNKKKLEDIMMYHNSVLRNASFGDPKIPGYCECHDCHYEIQIIKSYVNKFVKPKESELNDIVSGYVLLFDGTLRKTLSENAEKDREKSTSFTLERDFETKSLRYNPLTETIRSENAFTDRANCVKIMKSAPEFANVSEELLNQVFSMSLLSHYFEFGTYSSAIIPDVVLEITGVTISEQTKAHLERQVETSSQQMLTLEKMNPASTLEVYASRLGSNPGYYKVTTKGDKQVSTIGFHKEMFRTFLRGNEKKYDLSLSEIRTKHVVLAKVYSVLKRLGPAWHEHLSYSLSNYWDFLEEKHPELPGFFNGGCMLNANQGHFVTSGETFGALIPDLELGFTEYVNILQLKQLIIASRVVTIFAPPIRHLWLLFFNKAVEILTKYSDSDKVVLMIMPEKYVANIPETLTVFEHVPSRSQYVHKAYDLMKAKNVPLNDHVVRVFRTPNSDFELV